MEPNLGLTNGLSWVILLAPLKKILMNHLIGFHWDDKMGLYLDIYLYPVKDLKMSILMVHLT